MTPIPLANIQRREPRFGGFDEDEDEYEEPDRDTDYTSGYRADNEEGRRNLKTSYYR